MPDISMCKNINCPLKNSCYRFKAKPNPYRQSYSTFTYKVNPENPEKVTCDMYIPDRP